MGGFWKENDHSYRGGGGGGGLWKRGREGPFDTWGGGFGGGLFHTLGRRELWFFFMIKYGFLFQLDFHVIIFTFKGK